MDSGKIDYYLTVNQATKQPWHAKFYYTLMGNMEEYWLNREISGYSLDG